MVKSEFLVGDTVYHVVEPDNHGDIAYIHTDGYVRVHWKRGGVGKHPAEVLRTVSDFKIGDTVMFPGNPHKRRIAFISQFGNLEFADVAGQHNPEGFVKVEADENRMWREVEAGDIVTFKWRDEEFTATAYKDPDYILPQIMGMATTAMHKYKIVSIKRPKPPLPTANGTIIRSKVTGNEAHLIDGKWFYAETGDTTDPNEWDMGGWEVVRFMIKEGKNG